MLILLPQRTTKTSPYIFIITTVVVATLPLRLPFYETDGGFLIKTALRGKILPILLYIFQHLGVLD